MCVRKIFSELAYESVFVSGDDPKDNEPRTLGLPAHLVGQLATHITDQGPDPALVTRRHRHLPRARRGHQLPIPRRGRVADHPAR
ncbi:hypothetical protein Noca_0822 [Nocardioides sp. JS614]|nr:hypothetical protein Noca_0822 [Nocardioides sp. JS614]